MNPKSYLVLAWLSHSPKAHNLLQFSLQELAKKIETGQLCSTELAIVLPHSQLI